MVETEKTTILVLIGIGIATGIGKLLISNETLTARLVIGRALIGGATSMVACISLVYLVDPSPPVLWGVGSALGILGQQGIESAFNWFSSRASKP